MTGRLDLDRFDPMRTKSDDEAVRRGYVWDRDKAFRVQDFLESMCRLYVGQWAGRPIELMPFQQDFIWRLYGWVHKDTGLRRFREAYWEVAKKNGKSPVTGGLGLYHTVADGENAPEVYVLASSYKQAQIVYKNASKMISQEPEFAGLFHEVPCRNEIHYPDKNGFFGALSANAPDKDGFQPSLSIFDELHRQPNRDLWDVFQYAGRSRQQPLILSITTAGEPDKEHPCFQQHNRAIKVEDGSLIDVRFLGVVHGPREPDPDINDPRVWRMANPAMGHIFPEEEIAADLLKAKNEGPAQLANFKRLSLNIWVKIAQKWVDMQVWNDQAETRTDEEIEKSGDVWAAGLDMSAGNDLVAYVRSAGNVQAGVDVRSKFWIPEDTALKRQREEHIPYLEYAERGWVSLIPGPYIDPMVILAYILEDAERLGGKLKRIHSDFYNAREVGNGLTKAGLDFKWFVQGNLSFHLPIKTMGELIARKRYRHGDHPLLNYCAGNVVVDDKNKNQNMSFVKHKSTGRIDGMVAGAESLAGLMDLIGYDGTGGERAARKVVAKAPKIHWAKR